MPNSIREGRLHAETSVGCSLATLFAFGRSVCFDPSARVITVSERRWWSGRERHIPFAQISHLDTSFHELGPSVGAAVAGSSGRVEELAISVVLKKTHEKVRLFEFRATVAGHDDLGLDPTHHEVGFAQFLERARSSLRVPVGEPVQAATDAQGFAMVCTSCDRPNGPVKQKCTYCGAKCTRRAPAR